MARRPWLSATVACLAMLSSAGQARAQSITFPAGYPDRIVGGVDLGMSTRPANLGPLDLSYGDCSADMQLSFALVGSGFTGSDTFEVWASNTPDCYTPAARGVGSSAATCWEVAAEIPGVTQSNIGPITIDVRDIVGPQSAPPFPPSFAATQAQGETLGADACATQPTFTGVPMYIWFLAVSTMGTVDGTPYVYAGAGDGSGGITSTFIADMVGPPAPTGLSLGAGDGLLIPSWTPNLDSDTIGYDVFIDPPPGPSDAGAGDATVAGCSLGADDDGATVDAGCLEGGALSNLCNGTSITGALPAPALAGGFVQDAGVVVDDGGGVSGPGGISTIPSQYLVGADVTGLTVPSESTGSYTISGLTDAVTYTVVVAAVDEVGNVGPPSLQACNSPAQIEDFWSAYRQDGGGAGGGCALAVPGGSGRVGTCALLAGIVTTVAVARRRRRRR